MLHYYFQLVKKTILFISFLLLPLSSCRGDRFCPAIAYTYDFFYSIKDYYEDVISNDVDNYPEYSLSTVSDRRDMGYEVITYHGEYKLEEEIDGFDTEREYFLSFYESGSPIERYLSSDIGLVKEGSSYELHNFVFAIDLMADLPFDGCYRMEKNRKANFYPYPSSYRNIEREIVDDELTQKLYEKMKVIMKNYLKDIDNYCRENNKGLYSGGANKKVILFDE